MLDTCAVCYFWKGPSLKIYPVIMSGGAGTRLWPLSRNKKPKQYLNLFGQLSLLGATLQRCLGAPEGVNVASPIIVAGAHHADLIAAEFEEMGITPEAVLFEPFARNTAVVASVAATYVESRDPDGLVLLLPADHYVEDVGGFWAAVQIGCQLAQAGQIVTFGISPNTPETGYGYIKSGKAICAGGYSVDTFTEKPDLETAKAYLQAGTYFWNAGIFLYNAATMIAEMERHAPDVHQAGVGALEEAQWHDKNCTLAAGPLRDCPSISIDYALMEKTDMAGLVAPVDIGWDDVGSWAAISRLYADGGAATRNTLQFDASDNCLVSSGKLIAAIGVEGLVIVETDEAVLVVPKARAQDVSGLVKALKDAGRSDLL